MKNIFSFLLFFTACSYSAEQPVVPLRVILPKKNESNFKERADQIKQLEYLAGSNLKYLKFINKDKSGDARFIIYLKKGKAMEIVVLWERYFFGLFGCKKAELLTNADVLEISSLHGRHCMVIKNDSVYECDIHYTGKLPFGYDQKIEKIEF